MVSLHDPRLGPLREGSYTDRGWERQWKHTASGDPRLLPAALKERGVDLGIFTLV